MPASIVRQAGIEHCLASSRVATEPIDALTRKVESDRGHVTRLAALHFSFMSEDSDQEVVPTVLSNLTNVIDSDLYNFASGSKDIQSAALNATKFLFDLGERVLVKRVAGSLIVDPGSLVLSWFNSLSP